MNPNPKCYDAEMFIDVAKEYSNKNDCTQFSEQIWGSATSAVQRFCLEHIDTKIKSHKAYAKVILEVFPLYFSNEVLADMEKIFKNAEK